MRVFVANRHRVDRAIAGILVALTAVVGAVAVTWTLAASSFVATEVESGAVSGPAVIGSDSTASGRNYVQFGTAAAAATLHYAANTNGSEAALTGLGFDVFDVAGSTSNPAGVKSKVDGLPAGAKALVWVGNLDNAPVGSSCPAPGFTTAQFDAQVDALAGDTKVYGYYISDEPHPSVCPNAATDIEARANYIHAQAPGQQAFIVVLDGTNACGGTLGCEYNALAPGKTHVDLVGLDPYPCHFDASGNPVPCDDLMISQRVQAAEANGIAAAVIVPTFQTFGQEGRLDGKTIYYRTPTATELSSMLATWAALVPHPVMDYAYTWGVQCTASTCPAPQALSNHPELQTVMQGHNQ